MNHAHRQALIAAEIAGLEGDQNGALDLYDRAIRLAQTPPHRAMRTSCVPRMYCSMCRAAVAASAVISASSCSAAHRCDTAFSSDTA